MHYQLLKKLIDLVYEFDDLNKGFTKSSDGLNQFIDWLNQRRSEDSKNTMSELDIFWEGKQNGRTSDSVINTLLVHLSKYGKFHSKSILTDSDFSSQEDFIYLITLKTFGEMTKIDLIKKNIQDKPAGIKIIDRLVKKGFVSQADSKVDKRSKMVSITDDGLAVLEEKMPEIRKVSKTVTGNLTELEKLQLIMLLQKLDDFHNPLYINNEA